MAGLAVTVVGRQATATDDDELDALLTHLETLTDEDVQGLLAEGARTEQQP